MAVTEAASREQASNAKAPLPVKKSRHLAPAILFCSQLKTVSLTLSGVGRNVSTSPVKDNCLLRHFPAMMRTLFRFALFFE